ASVWEQRKWAEAAKWYNKNVAPFLDNVIAIQQEMQQMQLEMLRQSLGR
ncbi:MAG: hypothetical protein GX126_00965, partial [Bacteroidales bacterium]|nr:hypothetical protein [Bacteroidales bacterium]